MPLDTQRQPTPPAPQTEPLVTVSRAQYESLQRGSAELVLARERQRQAADETARQEAMLMAQRGEVTRALEMQQRQSERALIEEREKANASESRAKLYATTAELSRALASHDLAPGAAEQLTELWSSKFHVSVDPGSNQFAVRTADYRSPATFVAEMLAQPGFAHFRNSTPAASKPTGAPAAPAQGDTWGAALVNHMCGQKAARDADRAARDPVGDMTVPFGLRRRAN